MKFTAVFEEVPEGYIAFVEELPGANTQGANSRRGKRKSSGSRRARPRRQSDVGGGAHEGKSVIRENFPLRAA